MTPVSSVEQLTPVLREAGRKTITLYNDHGVITSTSPVLLLWFWWQAYNWCAECLSAKCLNWRSGWFSRYIPSIKIDARRSNALKGIAFVRRSLLCCTSTFEPRPSFIEHGHLALFQKSWKRTERVISEHSYIGSLPRASTHSFSGIVASMRVYVFSPLYG